MNMFLLLLQKRIRSNQAGCVQGTGQPYAASARHLTSIVGLGAAVLLLPYDDSIIYLVWRTCDERVGTPPSTPRIYCWKL